MIDLFVITLALFISFVISELFHRFKLPRVVGQIVAGIIIGLPFIKTFIGLGQPIDIAFLAEMGVVFLLLITGMEIDFNIFKKIKYDAFLIAFFGALFPFVAGFFVMQWLGFSAVVGLVVGASLSITAPGTNLVVLLELHKIKTKVGQILIGSAIIDDLFGIIFLMIVLLVSSNASALSFVWFPLKIIAFVFLIFMVFHFIPYLINAIVREKSEIVDFSMVIILGLLIAVLSNFLGLSYVVGAFIAGIIIQLRFKNKKEELKILGDLKVITFGFIIPFFFIFIGLHFNFSSVNLVLFSIIFVIAVVGKMLGSVVGGFFSKDLSFRQSTFIGWGMNSRGAVELIMAQTAFSAGIIGIELYSVIILMTIITTLIFPIAAKFYKGVK